MSLYDAKHYIIIELDSEEEQQIVTAMLTTTEAGPLNHKVGDSEDHLFAVFTIRNNHKCAITLVKE